LQKRQALYVTVRKYREWAFNLENLKVAKNVSPIREN